MVGPGPAKDRDPGGMEGGGPGSAQDWDPGGREGEEEPGPTQDQGPGVGGSGWL